MCIASDNPVCNNMICRAFLFVTNVFNNSFNSSFGSSDLIIVLICIRTTEKGLNCVVWLNTLGALAHSQTFLMELLEYLI